MFSYKGYVGQAEIDEESGLIFGDVIGLRDVVTFQGRTVHQARRSFRESIDLYLATCADEGRDPDKPYSGKILVRTKPQVHRALAAQAQAEGKSLNELVDQVLTRAARRSGPLTGGMPSNAAGRMSKRKRMKASREDSYY